MNAWTARLCQINRRRGVWFDKATCLKGGTDVTEQLNQQLDHSQRVSSYGQTLIFLIKEKNEKSRRAEHGFFWFVCGDPFEKSRKLDWQQIILDKTRTEEAADDKA